MTKPECRRTELEQSETVCFGTEEAITIKIRYDGRRLGNEAIRQLSEILTDSTERLKEFAEEL